MNKITTKTKLLSLLFFYTTCTIYAQDVSLPIAILENTAGEKHYINVIEHGAINAGDDTVQIDPRKNRFFFQLAYDGIGNVMISPPVIVPYYVSDYSSNGPTYTQAGNLDIRILSINLLSGGAKFRYNIFQPGKDFSVAITAAINPALFAVNKVFDGHGGDYKPILAVNFDFPVFAEFRFGRKATHFSEDRDVGFIAGVGCEFITLIMGGAYKVPAYMDGNGNFVKADMTLSWLQPCVEFGVAFAPLFETSVVHKTREFVAKFGLGHATNFVNALGSDDTNRSLSFSIAYVCYLGGHYDWHANARY